MTEAQEQPRKLNPRPSPISGVPPPMDHCYKPGESGNPGGRPPGADVRALLRKKIAARPHEDGFGDMAHKICDLVLDVASGAIKDEKDAVDAIKWTTDQACGKLTDKSEVSADVEVTGGVDIVRGHGPMRDPPDVPKPPPKKE